MGKTGSGSIIPGGNRRCCRRIADRLRIIPVAGPGFFSFLVGGIADGSMPDILLAEPWCGFAAFVPVAKTRLAPTLKSSLCNVCLCVYDWQVRLHFFDSADVHCLAANCRALLMEIGSPAGYHWHNMPVHFCHSIDDSIAERLIDMMRGDRHA
jgi:hypothetical protein